MRKPRRLRRGFHFCRLQIGKLAARFGLKQVYENKVQRSRKRHRRRQVRTQAMAMLRIVANRNPEPFADMVPATPDDSTCVVETGRP